MKVKVWYGGMNKGMGNDKGLVAGMDKSKNKKVELPKSGEVARDDSFIGVILYEGERSLSKVSKATLGKAISLMMKDSLEGSPMEVVYDVQSNSVIIAPSHKKEDKDYDISVLHNILNDGSVSDYVKARVKNVLTNVVAYKASESDFSEDA